MGSKKAKAFSWPSRSKVKNFRTSGSSSSTTGLTRNIISRFVTDRVRRHFTDTAACGPETPKARSWINDMRLGRIASFAEIAAREAQGERHIRLLAPLAFLSPHITAAIVDGTAPADLTVTGLAKALPYSWAEQEQRIGLSS
jgi:hypothetical protein